MMYDDETGKYNDWFNDNYQDNLVAFAEKMEDEFEEFCLNRYNIEPDFDDMED